MKVLFHELKNKMAASTDYAVQTSDYEFAAECSNECRRKGIQGAHTDFLICALAMSLRGAELRGILSVTLVWTEARSIGSLLYRLV